MIFSALALAMSLAADDAMPIASGKYQPTWESLQQYECPEWFKDAKFGIWAHWSPQCVPEEGDWYARGMYQEGSAQYNYQVKTYGHPSKFGYKDICNAWKAERWDPNKLMKLYKAAGAQYFVALANHHCNFDCWDSKYHEWNSVKVGPKKDIVGTWAKVARKNGMRFGVTVHSARTWDWFQVSHGADKSGPYKGVPYDGNLTKADGKGQWWDGLDPQELYVKAHPEGVPPDAAYQQQWFLRTKDLLDQMHPDLLYFDDAGLPLGDAGLRIAAHYYNTNMALHKGKVEAVLNTKFVSGDKRKALVLDIERGRSDKKEPFPWQTDTCIGDWHYNRHIEYKTAAEVVPMLVDIVSKNGNLLLNIPVRGDGTIDDKEIGFLKDMAGWMKINSEAIFGTRPWLVYGEGATRFRGGAFNEGAANKYSAQDIRFTEKKGVLYATLLGWPADRTVHIHSLANLPHVTGWISNVELLGSKAKLKWTSSPEDLTVQLPAEKPGNYAYVLKITGQNLNGFKPEEVAQAAAPTIKQSAAGDLVLEPATADIQGDGIQVEEIGGKENFGYWDSASDSVSWKVELASGGAFNLQADAACAGGESSVDVLVDGKAVTTMALKNTSAWNVFQPVEAAMTVNLPTGKHTLSIRPRAPWHAINLRAVRLTKIRLIRD